MWCCGFRDGEMGEIEVWEKKQYTVMLFCRKGKNVDFVGPDSVGLD